MAKNKKLTYDSKVGELYASPIGHDTIAKVLMQLGISDKAITNPLVSNLKLKTIHNITFQNLPPTKAFLLKFCLFCNAFQIALSIVAYDLK